MSTALAAALLLLPLRPNICVAAAKTEPCSRHSTCGPQPHMSKKNPPLSGWLGIALTHKINARLGVALSDVSEFLASLGHDLTPSVAHILAKLGTALSSGSHSHKVGSCLIHRTPGSALEQPNLPLAPGGVAVLGLRMSKPRFQLDRENMPLMPLTKNAHF